MSSCMCDSLVGWTTGRETPSVAGVIQPGSEGFQKLFFGQEEIAVPVYSRYCILLLQNKNWSLTSAEFSFVPSCFNTHMEVISLIWCCSSPLKYFFSFVLCDIFLFWCSIVSACKVHATADVFINFASFRRCVISPLGTQETISEDKKEPQRLGLIDLMFLWIPIRTTSLPGL